MNILHHEDLTEMLMEYLKDNGMSTTAQSIRKEINGSTLLNQPNMLPKNISPSQLVPRSLGF